MTEHDVSFFGTLLKEFRKRRHLTQQQLAQVVGVHRNAIVRWEQGDFLPDSKTMVLELARHLHLDDQESRQLLEASLTALSPYWLVPAHRNPFFTGREEILEALHEQLGTDKAAVYPQSVALCGFGGVGKTQIALEYAYRYSLEYSAVFWIAAESDEQILASLLHMAEVLRLPERDDKDQQHIIAAVQRWLGNHRGWLLIWDNLEKLEALQRFLPPARLGMILITTRMQALGTWAQGIELPMMEREEGMLFLFRRAKMLDHAATREHMCLLAESKPEEYQAAEALWEMMGGLPLALDQAGAYLEETGCGLVDYLYRYKQQRVPLLDRRGNVESDHPLSMATTFRLTWQRVEQDYPSAADLLRVCAFLSAEAIPEELFIVSARHLGPELAQLTEDPARFDLILATLRTFSLVSRDRDTRTLSIHRLIQALLRESMKPDVAQTWIERTVYAIAAAFPRAEFSTWHLCERYIQQVQPCYLLIKQAMISCPEAAQFMHEAGSYLLQRGRYIEAEPLFQQALAIRKQQEETLSLTAVPTLNYLAWSYWSQGKYQQAEPLYQQALSICEQQEESASLEAAETLNNLATLHQSQERYEQAEQLYLRSLGLRELLFGPEHPIVAESLHNLGILYLGWKKYEQAVPLVQRAISIRRQALGPEHYEFAISINNLARIYWSQGRYEEAEPLYQQALAIYQQQLGSEHPETANPLNNLAKLYWSQGRYEEAEPLYQQALAIYQQQLGPEHPYTNKCRDNLARLYVDQGKHEQAEQLLLQILTIQERQLGATHPHTRQARDNYATLLHKMGREVEAVALSSTQNNW